MLSLGQGGKVMHNQEFDLQLRRFGKGMKNKEGLF